MDSKYIITPDGNFVSEEELYHWGIKGMKWGVRRYQNADGSLTAAGRKRYTNSDGSLNKRGEKYVAKETERLAKERTKIENQKRTDSKLATLDTMRKTNDALRNGDGDKDESTSKNITIKIDPQESYSMNLLSNTEIKNAANRMNDEDRLKDLLMKRGYNVSLDQKTEIDKMIDSLNKQKTLIELTKEVDKLNRGKTETEKRIEILTQKRDVAKLEKEIRDNTPQKTSKISKFMNSQIGQSLTNKLVQSGENVITTYIKSKFSGTSDKEAKVAAKDVSKILSNEASTISKSVEKSVNKQKTKEAKAETRQAEKAAKELDKILDNSPNYGTKAYEKKVDKILEEMDSQAWDIYYSKYANK